MPVDLRQHPSTRVEHEATPGKPARGRGSKRSLLRHSAVLLATIPAVVIIGLLVVTVFLSLRSETPGQTEAGPATLEHWLGLFGDPFVVTAIRNTILFSGQTLIWALIFGISMAWLVERTDMGGRSLVYSIVTIGVLTPGFFTAMGYMYLMHPTIGTVNVLLQDVTGNPDFSLNIISVSGMAWVQGLSVGSLMFVLTSGSLANMDAALEESARVHGANYRATLRRITFPISRPALLGAALYVAAVAISAFDVPLVIGLSNRIYVFSTYLYTQVQGSGEGLQQYGMSAAFATVMISIAIVWSWWYTRMLARSRRFEVITGKSYKPKLVELGRWKWVARAWVGGYLTLAIILPLVILVWASFLPYMQPIGMSAVEMLTLENYRELPWNLISRGAKNTAILAVLAPTIAMAMSLLFSWVVLRTKYRWRGFYDYVAFLPHAVPNVIFAFAAFLVVLYYPLPGGWDLYGTTRLLLILYVLMMLSFGTRLTNSALIQVHREVEESARMSGAGPLTMVRRILLPLLRPTLMLGWIWLMMLVLRELTIAAMLVHPQNMTLQVAIWNEWSSGRQTTSSAMSVLLMVLMVPIIALCFKKFGSVWHENSIPQTPRE